MGDWPHFVRSTGSAGLYHGHIDFHDGGYFFARRTGGNDRRADSVPLRAVNCFAKGTFAQKAARVAAAVTTITCIGFVLVETYSVYEPWLMAKQGERTSGIIMLFGPLLFGVYSAVFSFSVGAILFGAAKLNKLVKRTEP